MVLGGEARPVGDAFPGRPGPVGGPAGGASGDALGRAPAGGASGDALGRAPAGGAQGGGQRSRNRRGRDRRGRGRRGPLAWPPVPAMATRADRFDELVLDAASRLETRLGPKLGPQLALVEFAVEDVPPSDPAPWEAGEVALGRYFPPDGGQPPRIVVYRRPVETRSNDLRELTALVNDVVVEQVAAYVGMAPEDIDDGYEQD